MHVLLICTGPTVGNELWQPVNVDQVLAQLAGLQATQRFDAIQKIMHASKIVATTCFSWTGHDDGYEVGSVQRIREGLWQLLALPIGAAQELSVYGLHVFASQFEHRLRSALRLLHRARHHTEADLPDDLPLLAQVRHAVARTYTELHFDQRLLEAVYSRMAERGILDNTPAAQAHSLLKEPNLILLSVLIALNLEENLDWDRCKGDLRKAYELALQIPKANEEHLANLQKDLKRLEQRVAQARNTDRATALQQYKEATKFANVKDPNLKALAKIFPEHESLHFTDFVTPQDLEVARFYAGHVLQSIKTLEKHQPARSGGRAEMPTAREGLSRFTEARQPVHDPQGQRAKHNLIPFPDLKNPLAGRLTRLITLEFRALQIPSIDENYALVEIANSQIFGSQADTTIIKTDTNTYAEDKNELGMLVRNGRAEPLHSICETITKFEDSVYEQELYPPPKVMSALINLLALPKEMRSKLSTFALDYYKSGINQKLEHALGWLHAQDYAAGLTKEQLMSATEGAMNAPPSYLSSQSTTGRALNHGDRSTLRHVPVIGHPQFAYVSARTARRYKIEHDFSLL
ncbi:hypothetical protein OIV83_005921 [Microbotryomycetes sp. JL201]|nr:hypothetical protein OIV83_005921 [Microbotryomycetes sp. JL201]